MYALWVKRRKDCEPGTWMCWTRDTFDQVMEDFFYIKSQDTAGLEGLRIEYIVPEVH